MGVFKKGRKFKGDVWDFQGAKKMNERKKERKEGEI
jgi:hypothetical protein